MKIFFIENLFFPGMRSGEPSRPPSSLSSLMTSSTHSQVQVRPRTFARKSRPASVHMTGVSGDLINSKSGDTNGATPNVTSTLLAPTTASKARRSQTPTGRTRAPLSLRKSAESKKTPATTPTVPTTEWKSSLSPTSGDNVMSMSTDFSGTTIKRAPSNTRKKSTASSNSNINGSTNNNNCNVINKNSSSTSSSSTINKSGTKSSPAPAKLVPKKLFNATSVEPTATDTVSVPEELKKSKEEGEGPEEAVCDSMVVRTEQISDSQKSETVQNDFSSTEGEGATMANFIVGLDDNGKKTGLDKQEFEVSVHNAVIHIEGGQHGPLIEDPIFDVKAEAQNIVRQIENKIADNIESIESAFGSGSSDFTYSSVKTPESPVANSIDGSTNPFLVSAPETNKTEDIIDVSSDNVEEKKESGEPIIVEPEGDKEDIESDEPAKPKILTEEAAKAAIAEKRRLAREAVERETARMEEEKRLEEERIRLEEEEAERVAREARAGEEERLRRAIEEQQKREEEEKLRREEEERARVEKEAQDKEAAREAERVRIEMLERLKREEEERMERKRRVEAIMARTRKQKDDAGGDSQER